MLGVAERREGRVIAREVEPLAERREHAEHHQRRPDAIDGGERRVLQRQQHGGEHQGAAQADARNDQQHQGPQHEAQHPDRRDGEKDAGRRDAAAQQKDAEKHPGDAPGELLQRGVGGEPVDVRIGEEFHGHWLPV